MATLNAKVLGDLLKSNPLLVLGLLKKIVGNHFRFQGKDIPIPWEFLERNPELLIDLLPWVQSIISTHQPAVDAASVDETEIGNIMNPVLNFGIVSAHYSHERFPQRWTPEAIAEKKHLVPMSRLIKMQEGEANIPYKTKVRFDITPDPDTKQFVDANSLKVEWYVEREDGKWAKFVGLGEYNFWDDDNGVQQRGVKALEESDFDIGFGGRAYARSLGFSVPINFKSEGKFKVYALLPSNRKKTKAIQVNIS